MTLKYEVPCPVLPVNHYVAKGMDPKVVALDLFFHCYQNHRNEPEEAMRQAQEAVSEDMPTT